MHTRITFLFNEIAFFSSLGNARAIVMVDFEASGIVEMVENLWGSTDTWEECELATSKVPLGSSRSSNLSKSLSKEFAVEIGC